jgi:hypothetical protein
MTTRPVYATRSMIIAALDIPPSPRTRTMINRALTSATQQIEDVCGGVTFYPWVGTRSFDWPNVDRFKGRSLMLWSQLLTSVTQITSGGTVLDPSYYHLRPGTGPPYDEILLDSESPVSWMISPSTGMEDAVTVQGLWGHGADQMDLLGALFGAVSDTDTTVVLGSTADPIRTSPGAILWIGTEIMHVTRTSWTDSGIDVSGAGLTESVADTLLTVSSTSPIVEGQEIIIGREKLFVTDVLSSTTCLVQRAQHGTVLAAHASGAMVTVPWSLTVERGALGSTAAAHDDASEVYVHRVPGLVEQTATALSIVEVQDQIAGYARPSGGPAGARASVISREGPGTLLDQCVQAYRPRRVFGTI